MREKITKVINKLDEVVGSTMGPGGKLVGIYDGYHTHVTKDGVTVAKALKFSDVQEEAIADIIREASIKVAERVGDGTTSSIVLTKAFYDYAKATSLYTLRMVVDLLQEELPKITKKASKKDLLNVLRTSVNGDPVLFGLLSKVFESIGPEGTLKVSESKTGEDYINFTRGLEFPAGYASKYFITDEIRKVFKVKGCQVALFNGEIGTYAILENIISNIDKTMPALILCNDISDNNVFTLTSSLQAFPEGICVVKMPSYQRQRARDYDDIGNFVSEEFTDSFELNDFIIGKADVEVSAKRLVLENGDGCLDNLIASISQDIATLKENFTNTDEEKVQLEDLTKRLNRLNTDVAEIFVGAPTIAAITEKIDRVDDGWKALESAHRFGFVPGGGQALRLLIDESNFEGLDEREERLLGALHYKICANMGIFEESKDYVFEGVLDPAKSLEVSLRTAYTITEILIKLENVIIS